MPPARSSAPTKCSSEVPGLAKQTSIPFRVIAASRLSAPFTEKSPSSGCRHPHRLRRPRRCAIPPVRHDTRRGGAVRSEAGEAVAAWQGRGPGNGSAWTRQAAGCPQAVGVAGGEPAAVDADLVVDELEVLPGPGELGGYLGAVGLQEGQPFLFVAGPGGDELGVTPDGPDGHAGGPQPGADDDPVEVELVVAPPRWPPPAGRPAPP